MTTPSLRTRILLVDLFKALAAQIIVLHHLAWYGPLTDQAAGLAPWVAALKEGLADHGRYAVAIFIATGGFLAAQTLSARGLGSESPGCLIRDRYFRLVMPFAVALLLVVVAMALAGQWMTHDSIGSPPTFKQILAHLGLLHGLLGFESLSAGVWYVAIDFQLYALLVLLLWLGAKLSRERESEFSATLPLLLVALVSLFYFSRDTRWEDTAFYFFGIYALGVGAGWAIRSGHRAEVLWVIAIVALLAVLVDFRPRIVLAALAALMLGCTRLHMTRVEMRSVHYLGGASYALFLVHFPVCLVVNAAFQRFAAPDPTTSALGVLVAWLASNLVADLFHRFVESPLARWQKRRLVCRARRAVLPKSPLTTA